MAFIRDTTYDALLNDIKNNASRLDITNAEATTYAEATSTYTLGNKTGISYTGPAAGDVSGRKVTIDAITDGSVTGTDTATHVALTNGSDTLYLTVALSSSESVTSGNTFTLTAFKVEVTDAT
jgi:hypothetical protein